MRLRHPFLRSLSLKIVGLVVLVFITVGLSYYVVQAFTQAKRYVEMQALASSISNIFRENLVEINARLFYEASRLDSNPNAFHSSAKKLLQDYPAVLAVELRSTNGEIIDVVDKYGSQAASSAQIRKSLPPWVLADFEAVAKGRAPKMTAIYGASLSPYFSQHAGDLQFLAEEFFPLSSGRGVMVVLFNPSSWFFGENLVAQFQQNLQLRFKLETQTQEVIASSDNSSSSAAPIERYVTPITYATDGPLYLAIENHKLIRTNPTHILEVIVAVLGILILLAGLLIFKGWQEYSRALLALRNQEQQLLDQAKFVSLGEISTILAHELNQPLAAIEAYSSASTTLLSQTPLDQSRLFKAVVAIRGETERINQIIKNIRNYIVSNQTQIVDLDPSQLVESLKNVMQMQANRYQATLVIEKRQGFMVQVDRLMLEQVILNLARNAYEAMLASPLGKRVLTIVIDRNEISGSICFTDTGPGISPEVGAKLFTPFFSTKRESMGIALSLCRSLVERYQGQLNWQNTPGGGAQFTISFRLASPQEG